MQASQRELMHGKSCYWVVLHPHFCVRLSSWFSRVPLSQAIPSVRMFCREFIYYAVVMISTEDICSRRICKYELYKKAPSSTHSILKICNENLQHLHEGCIASLPAYLSASICICLHLVCNFSALSMQSTPRLPGYTPCLFFLLCFYSHWLPQHIPRQFSTTQATDKNIQRCRRLFALHFLHSFFLLACHSLLQNRDWDSRTRTLRGRACTHVPMMRVLWLKNRYDIYLSCHKLPCTCTHNTHSIPERIGSRPCVFSKLNLDLQCLGDDKGANGPVCINTGQKTPWWTPWWRDKCKQENDKWITIFPHVGLCHYYSYVHLVQKEMARHTGPCLFITKFKTLEAASRAFYTSMICFNLNQTSAPMH